MTLHEAIITIISQENSPLSPKEIAEKINEQKLYKREDKQPISATQVRARVNSYTSIFSVSEDLIYVNNLDSLIDRKRNDNFISLLITVFASEPLKNKKIIILLLFYIRIIPINIPRYLKSNYDENRYNDFKSFLNDFLNVELAFHKIHFKNFSLFFDSVKQELFTKKYPTLKVLDLFLRFSEFKNRDAIYVIEKLHHSILRLEKNLIIDINNSESINYLASQFDSKANIVLYDTSELSLVYLKKLLIDKKSILIHSSVETRAFFEIYKFLYKLDSSIYKSLDELVFSADDHVITYGSIDSFSMGRPKRENRKEFTWEKVFKLLDHFKQSENIFCLTFQSDLRAENKKLFRKELIHSGNLKSVIRLVDGSLLNTGIHSYFLNVTNTPTEYACFIDLNISTKNGFLSKKVKYSEIIKKDYLIDSNNYLHKDVDKLDNFFRNESTTSLKNVLVKTHYASMHNENDLTEKDLNYKVLQPKDFVKDSSQNVIDSELIIFKDYGRKRWTLIKEPAVLIPIHSVGRKALKYEAVEPLIIAEGIIALFPDLSKISLDFLHVQMNSDFTRIQLEMLASGTLVKRLSKYHLDQIKIFVPSLDDQEISIQEKKTELVKTDIAVEELSDYKIINILEHSLKQSLGAINNDIESLKKYIIKKEENQQLIKMSDSISTSPNSSNLIKVFDRMKGNYSTIQNTLSNMKKLSSIDDKTLNLERITFKQYVEEIINQTTLDMKIYYVTKINPNLKITIDKILFYEVIKNLIINSIKHANKESIVFGFTAHNEESLSIIEYWDDGDGFPENFMKEDFKNFGTSFGKTKGSGLGGFIINRVIEKHNGTLDLKKEEYQRGYTAIAETNIKIPLSEERGKETYQSWKPGDKMTFLTISKYTIKIEIPNLG